MPSRQIVSLHRSALALIAIPLLLLHLLILLHPLQYIRRYPPLLQRPLKPRNLVQTLRTPDQFLDLVRFPITKLHPLRRRRPVRRSPIDMNSKVVGPRGALDRKECFCGLVWGPVQRGCVVPLSFLDVLIVEVVQRGNEGDDEGAICLFLALEAFRMDDQVPSRTLSLVTGLSTSTRCFNFFNPPSGCSAPSSEILFCARTSVVSPGVAFTMLG